MVVPVLVAQRVALRRRVLHGTRLQRPISTFRRTRPSGTAVEETTGPRRVTVAQTTPRGRSRDDVRS